MKEVILNGYKIRLVTNLVHITTKKVYQLKDLQEDICKKLVTEIDRGERYSKNSRYTYHTPFDNKNALQCGTAKAAVQRVIINKLKPNNMNHFISIQKV